MFVLDNLTDMEKKPQQPDIWLDDGSEFRAGATDLPRRHGIVVALDYQ